MFQKHFLLVCSCVHLLSIVSLKGQKILIVDKIQAVSFLFYMFHNIFFVSHIRNLYLNQGHNIFIVCFLLEVLIILALIFKSMTHIKLISIWFEITSVFLKVLFQDHMMKNLSLPIEFSWNLCQKTSEHSLVGMFLDCLLGSTNLYGCSYAKTLKYWFL